MSEKLVQYLDGELSGSEKDDLEKQLVTDRGLQAELESLKLAREAIRSYGLKQQVTGIHQQMMNELQTPVRGSAQLVASSVTVLPLQPVCWLF
jgi:negative regulator of sigma E activity